MGEVRIASTARPPSRPEREGRERGGRRREREREGGKEREREREREWEGERASKLERERESERAERCLVSRYIGARSKFQPQRGQTI